MNTTDFFYQLLEIPDLKIREVEQNRNQIIIHCELEKGEECCPLCNVPTCEFKQYKHRKVRDLDISGKEVWLHIRIKQMYCNWCNKYFNQTRDWLLPYKSYTKRQGKWMFDMCAKQPFTEVGALLNIHHKTVERWYYEQAEQQIKLEERYAKVRKLGIDEIAHRKGKKDFVCVLVNLETNTELDILPDRKKETLIAHFQSLGAEFCNQIEVVSCDFWKTYKNVAQECFPNAEVVIDRFHIVKLLNDVLDKKRKELRKEFKKEDCFKYLKWKLFKRPEKCSEEEKQSIEEALDKSWELKELYELRNTFNAMFDFFTNKIDLTEHLEQWLEYATILNNECLNKFIKTMQNWKEHIVTFAEQRITNAATEGLNNYIRYFKRISFGLPNFEHMRLRILANSC